MAEGPAPDFIPLAWHKPDRRGRPLALLLLLLTALTTTTLGSRLAYNFDNNLPAFDLEHDLSVFAEVLRAPATLAAGLPYSLALLAILLAHEMGHYLACIYYGIAASPPYFLPAPTFIGTFGAFIRFRSAVRSRRQLFDIGIAGPLAGFAVLLPLAAIGVAWSKVVPGIAGHSEIHFGAPPLMQIFSQLLFPGVPVEDVYLHPVARAAWVGLLATALNLLPVGQLDGGHLVYAAVGEWHKRVSLAVIAAMIPLGFLYRPWWVWAVVLFLIGRRHFPVVGDRRLGRGRWWLLLLSLIVFLLSFTAAPLEYRGDQDLFG